MSLAISTDRPLLDLMLGWSMNLFRVRGIRLAVHFTLFPLLALAAFEGWTAEEGGGWLGVAWSLGMLTAIFTCVVLHELGHSLMAMQFGVRVPRILLLPIGGMAELDDIPREPQREVLIAVAGPAVNYGIIFALWLVAGWPTESFFGDYPESFVGFAHMMIHFNLMMGTFNFIPAFPMDGGRVLRALLAMRLPYLRATFWAATVGKILALIGVLGAFAVVRLGFAAHPYYQLAGLFTFIFVAGEIEYRVVRRRELEEAHWRATFKRLYPDASAAPPPTPPALTS